MNRRSKMRSMRKHQEHCLSASGNDDESKGEEGNDTAIDDDIVKRFDNISFYSYDYSSKKASKSYQKKAKKNEKHQKIMQEIDDQKRSVKNTGEEEWRVLENRLESMNKKIFPIVSDGHCLYRAILHQLNLLKVKEFENDDVYELRKKIALMLLVHKGDLIPFMDEKDSTDEGFERYCSKVRDTAEWGGELELQMVVKVIQRRVEVLSGEKETFVYGEEYEHEGSIQLAFHRHLLAAGGHYNSVIAIE